MNFDPEKVIRAQACDFDFRLSVVPASDYDQLLEDYKEAISQIRVLIAERDALVPKTPLPLSCPDISNSL